MEIKVKKTVDMLTTKTVSILTQKFIELDGIDTQVGGDHRCAYANSETGRKDLAKTRTTECCRFCFCNLGGSSNGCG